MSGRSCSDARTVFFTGEPQLFHGPPDRRQTGGRVQGHLQFCEGTVWLLPDQRSESVQLGRAQLFYYMNRTAYNGLCRFNSRGEFNAPFGQYKSIAYAKSFGIYRELFADWRFTTGDFAALSLEDDDFVYADPPYDVEFTAYSRGGFSWDDQVRTAEVLARHSGPVILVNQATKRITGLYRKLGFSLLFHDAPRRISCTGDRTPAKEVFASRNL